MTGVELSRRTLAVGKRYPLVFCVVNVYFSHYFKKKRLSDINTHTAAAPEIAITINVHLFILGAAQGHVKTNI